MAAPEHKGYLVAREYKQMRGFDAQPTWSSHFLADPRLRSAIDRFLAAERDEASDTIDFLPDRSALKPAPSRKRG